MGGLTCGTYLAKAGMKVLMCEQHSVPGGYCTSFKKEGFSFEASLHWLNGCGKGGWIYRVLDELGLKDKIEFIQLDPVRRIIGNGYDLTMFSDTQRLDNDLSQMFPAERNGIHQFIADCTALVDKTSTAIMPYMGKSYRQVIDSLFKDEKLKLILYSLASPSWSAIYPMFQIGWLSQQDYYFPKTGGAKALAYLFSDAFQMCGGELRLGEKVNRILIENRKVLGIELESGEQIKAEYVVSNADARLTFLKLVGRELLSDDFVTTLSETKISPPGFLVSLGVDLDLERTGFGEEMISYNPAQSLEELSTTDPKRCPITLIIYSLRDPSLAPLGKHTMGILAVLPYDYMNNWGIEKDGKRGEQYQRLKQRVADDLISSAENVIPGLSQHIVCRNIATPLTYERYTLNTKGSMMGWILSSGNLASLSLMGPRTPIKNLLQAGHWTIPGGGVPPAILSGKNVAELILGGKA
jgi:prolycopene isomerase